MTYSVPEVCFLILANSADPDEMSHYFFINCVPSIKNNVDPDQLASDEAS